MEALFTRRTLNPTDEPVKSALSKLKTSVLRDGVWATARRVVRHALYQLNFGGHKARRAAFEKSVLALPTPGERFEAIYLSNVWRSDESASGPGSTLAYTKNLRGHLPELFEKFNVRRVFDAPCGDFNWMRSVLQGLSIEYVGGDIVQPLVEDLQRRYGGPGRAFQHVDLTRGPFPESDLMICRDCLFHLSDEDIRSALRVFLDSGSRLLLTTTHLNDGSFINTDIASGDFRLLDLFSAPYNLPANPLMRIDDWLPPDPPRQMCLWSREQVAEALQTMDRM